MRFNLDNPTGKAAAEKKLSELTGIIELKKIEKTRSDRQNRALHLFFTKICEQLNNVGETMYIPVPFSDKRIEAMHTPELYKEFVWKVIQLDMFNKKSTTQLTTQEINQILDVLALNYSRLGIQVHFPCSLDKYLEIIDNF
jgi:hypothetical protein